VFKLEVTMELSTSVIKVSILFMKKQIAGLPLSVPVRAAVHDLNPEVSFGSGGLKL